MSVGKEYAEGDVLFDQLTVVGKDFFSSLHPSEPRYYEYAFDVRPVLSTKKRKKGDPEHYEYHWGGYINIGMGSRLHLHNVESDTGLVKQEAKLTLLKDTLVEFLKEFKARMKQEAKKDLHVKHWLNPADSRYTGYVAYHLDKTGSGSISIADCHRANIVWVYIYRNEKGKVSYSEKEVKSLEDLVKGLSKAIGAVQQLRKFFERELDLSPLEK